LEQVFRPGAHPVVPLQPSVQLVETQRPVAQLHWPAELLSPSLRETQSPKARASQLPPAKLSLLTAVPESRPAMEIVMATWRQREVLAWFSFWFAIFCDLSESALALASRKIS
jgi:hypothetical protein